MWTRFFSAPSSTDPGKHGSIESMKANMKASWQASTASYEKLSQRQNRYNFSFNSPFKIKHAKRINILVVLQYKLNKELSKISSIFWWYSYFIVFNKNKFTLRITNILQFRSYILLALYFILSFILNCLGLQTY